MLLSQLFSMGTVQNLVGVSVQKKNLLHVDIVSVFLIGDICWSCHGGEPKSAESTHSSIEAL